MATVREITSILDAAYPSWLAEDWDSVGLTCGRPDAEVATVLLAVDPLPQIVDEAIACGAQLIVTHHPLFLRGVHDVAATNAKGEVITRCIENGIALFSAHTNADHACPGVSDALALALGLTDLRPLVPDSRDASLGTGRIGTLTSWMSLEAFGSVVAGSLPATAHGVRIAGDLGAEVRTVAVCGGAGDSFLDAAASAADVYVTSDLRHHRAQDHLADGGCALVDVAHWASEWPWLQQAASVIGGTVRTVVSTLPTDPWAAHLGSTS
jgi:dinuclear metal center YbgI/SA1388 family protein